MRTSLIACAALLGVLFVTANSEAGPFKKKKATVVNYSTVVTPVVVSTTTGTVAEVVVNGRTVSAARFVSNGSITTGTLASGHRIIIQMRDGQAVSAQVVDRLGNVSTAQVQSRFVARDSDLVVVITVSANQIG